MQRFIRYFAFVIVVALTDADAKKDRDQLPMSEVKYNPVCPPGCATCSAYNGCVTCLKTHFFSLQWHGMRQTGSCLEECPFGYYAIRKRGHGKCMKCSLPFCENCSNSTACTSCEIPYFLVDGQCLDKCPETLPYFGQSRRCREQVDCEVGSWGFWGFCSRKGVTCGYKYGLQMRSRPTLQLPSENGLKCPMIVQYRKCRMKHRFCEDTETNESDISKFNPNDINWKKLERLLMKHKKRKQREEKRMRNKMNRKKKIKDDILSQQLFTNSSLSV